MTTRGDQLRIRSNNAKFNLISSLVKEVKDFIDNSSELQEVADEGNSEYFYSMDYLEEQIMYQVCQQLDNYNYNGVNIKYMHHRNGGKGLRLSW